VLVGGHGGATGMSKRALLVVDMQQGLFAGPRHDAEGLLTRLNQLATRLRANGTPIIFIQHCGPEGNDLHPSQPGHAIHQALTVEVADTIITKASCDAFLGNRPLERPCRVAGQRAEHHWVRNRFLCRYHRP
jgi:nicotinamidase-related amidase